MVRHVFQPGTALGPDHLSILVLYRGCHVRFLEMRMPIRHEVELGDVRCAGYTCSRHI